MNSIPEIPPIGDLLLLKALSIHRQLEASKHILNDKMSKFLSENHELRRAGYESLLVDVIQQHTQLLDISLQGTYKSVESYQDQYNDLVEFHGAEEVAKKIEEAQLRLKGRQCDPEGLLKETDELLESAEKILTPLKELLRETVSRTCPINEQQPPLINPTVAKLIMETRQMRGQRSSSSGQK